MYTSSLPGGQQSRNQNITLSPLRGFGGESLLYLRSRSGWIVPSVIVATGLVLFLGMLVDNAIAQVSLPGTDASDQLEAAGTLLRIVDTALFKWGARLLAGVSILSAAWALTQQRFAVAFLAAAGAIVFGFAPTWVKNIFFDWRKSRALFGAHDRATSGSTRWFDRR